MPDTPGTRLKKARLERGLSVDDIVATTKMRPNIIHALEADDYTGFPSITHARNFLALYGKHLKVDVVDGLNSLATPAKIGIENYQYLNAGSGESSSDTRSYRVPRQPMRLHRGSRSSNDQAPRNLGLIALVILGLFLVGYLAINLRRLNLSAPAPAETSDTASDPFSSNAPASAAPAESARTPLTSGPRVLRNTGTPAPAATPFYAPIERIHPLIRTPAPTPIRLGNTAPRCPDQPRVHGKCSLTHPNELQLHRNQLQLHRNQLRLHRDQLPAHPDQSLMHFYPSLTHQN